MIKFGHRGAGGYAPGNTLFSFKKALEFDIDYIEMDVARCKTGEIVAIHDTRIDRTTGGTGFVEDKSFQELRRLDAGEGEKIPTLREALDLIDHQKKVNIEIKGGDAAEDVLAIVEEYIHNRGWKYEDFLIASFNHYELQAIHRKGPRLKLGVIVASIPIGYAECAQKVKAYSIHISKEFITKPFVDDAHRRGLKAFVYTINDREYYDRMIDLGVDGIFTDYPDRFPVTT